MESEPESRDLYPVQPLEPRWVGLRPFQQHSQVLLVAGLAYCGIGLSYILADPTPGKAKALSIALGWWDLGRWGWVFIIAGILAVISSRWPPISRSWGYVALTGLSSGWSAFYLVGIIFDDSPLTNMSSVVIWGLIAYLWRSISGLRNPGDI